MLVFSYGIPKSASTFGYQLISEVLAQNGHPQDKVDHPALLSASTLNFAQTIEAAAFQDLDRQVGEDRFLVIKTHEPPAPLVRQWIVDKHAFAFASFRDPRDVALALLDAGRQSRRRGFKLFSEFHDLEDVCRHLPHWIAQFHAWREIPGVVPLGYDQVAFETAATLRMIARHLDMPVETRPILLKFATGRYVAHLNRGIQDRHEKEMTDSENALFEQDFADFVAYCQDYRARPPSWMAVRNRAWRVLRPFIAIVRR